MIRLTKKVAPMIRAPVLPAETKASPFPSASRRRPTAMEQPLCSLRMLLGSSSIVMTSEASTISIPSSGTAFSAATRRISASFPVRRMV